MSAGKDKLDQLMKVLQQQWGIEGFCLDEQNACHFSSAFCQFLVELTEDATEVAISAPVAKASNFIHESPLMLKLLEMNYSEARLLGASLSIDPDHQNVMMSYHAPLLDMQAYDFGNMVGNFCDAAADVVMLLTDFLAETQQTIQPGMDSSEAKRLSLHKV